MVDFHEDIFIQVYHVPCIYLPTSVFVSPLLSFLIPLLFNNDSLYFCKIHLEEGKEDMRHLSF